MKKKHRFTGFLIFILILAVGGLGYFSYTLYNSGLAKDTQIAELEIERDSNSKTAWVALTDIRKGEKLEPDVNVEIRQLYSGLERAMFWQPDGDTNIATNDIMAEVPILETMVATYVPANDIRRYEVSVANLMTTQCDYDYIDVRIAYPDGSDYVVLAKKQIEDLSLSNCLFTTELNESEIQMINSATLDAYMNTGCRIYTVVYPEDTLQEASIPNYPAKEATLEMMIASNNPNLATTALTKATAELNKQARRNLEERLGIISEEEAQEAEQAWTDIQSKFQAEVAERLSQDY